MNYYQRIQMLEKGIAFTQLVQEIKRYHLLWRNDLTLLIVLSGEIELSVRGQLRILREDDVVLIGSNQTFSTLAQHKGCFALFLSFDPAFFTRYGISAAPLVFNCATTAETRRNDSFNRLRGYSAGMMHCATGNNPDDFLSLEAYFLMLMSYLLRDFPPEIPSEGEKVGVEHRLLTFDLILNYINNNYKNNITLQDIARIGNYNSSYVSHLFKEKMGIGFREYLTRRRLQSAVAELNHTDKNMSSIALDNGFADIKSFYLNFEKMYKKTPLQYKKQILSGDFSNLRLQDPQAQHNYSEARVILPHPLVEKKLKEYIDKVKL